jgi:hypothetical protein
MTKKLFYNIKLSQVLAAGTLIGLGWPIYSTEQLCVCVWLCVNVCVCVCVWEREREREREKFNASRVGWWGGRVEREPMSWSQGRQATISLPYFGPFNTVKKKSGVKLEHLCKRSHRCLWIHLDNVQLSCIRTDQLSVSAAWWQHGSQICLQFWFSEKFKTPNNSATTET